MNHLAIQTARRNRLLTMQFLALLGFSFTRDLPAQSSVLEQWESITATSFFPPDSHGAAGPNGIIATVNLQIGYRRFDGTTIWGLVGLGDFMAPAGNGKSGNTDPKVLFDPSSGRFFVAMQENLDRQSFINVAVSKTSDPRSSGANDWFFYRVEMTQSDGVNLFGGDFTCLGLDSQALYLSYNMYQLPIAAGAGGFRNSQILVLDKAALGNGTLTVNRLNASGATLQPVSVFGAESAGNVAYFVESSGSTFLTLWALADPLGTASLSSNLVTVTGNGGLSAVGAPQSVTATLLDIDFRAQGSAFWHDGCIWFCHTAGGSRAQVFYYRIAANDYPSGTPSIGESGHIDGGSGVWTFCPAIGGNARGDVCIVYSQSSATQNPTVMCTLRRAEDAAFATPITIKVSPHPYIGLAGTNHVARWGDFAAVSADQDGSFWVVQEWARSSGSDDWSTWWANVNAWGFSHVIYVDAAYGAGAPDGSASRPFPTITQANQAALDGTVVRIASGWYPEIITFSKNLRLEARNGPVTVGP